MKKNTTLAPFFLLLLLMMSCKEREFENPIDPGVPLKPPTITSVAFLADTSVVLKWDDPNKDIKYPNAKLHYEIEQGLGSHFSPIGNSEINTIKITGIFNTETIYYFRVRARSLNNYSPYSLVTSTSLAFPSPSNLTVALSSETTAVLQWQNNSTLTKKIFIERSTNQTNEFVVVDSVDFPAINRKILGIYFQNDLNYFRIRAKSLNNFSTYTPVVSTALSFPAPTFLFVASITSNTVILEWNDNNAFETIFEIEQSVNDTNHFSLVETVDLNITTATLSGTFDSSSIYYFRIRAISVHNTSIYSTIANATRAMLLFGELIYVQGGTFQMGNNTGSSDEQPVHNLTIKSFYIGRNEVTQNEWKQVVDWKKLNGGTTLSSSPSYFGSSALPVEKVSWTDVITWISYLNLMMGTNSYRLPTESEWEYAAKGGIHNMDNYTYSGSNTIEEVAWYNNNSDGSTHRKGTKKANQLGIFDMSGNVWEWCSDWYHTSYTGAPTDGNSWDTQQNGYPTRIVRGGSWELSSTFCRVTQRNGASPGDRFSNLGFRYVKQLEP
ncbi:MAG: SUMF1/EgtB/PvdO family nonheme iron enzyme [Ignavibacteriae bacterium]|nr:SUMF1/EgtB/PvdO family nonheme iron enzyme [Ignavibacteriota bacterium]